MTGVLTGFRRLLDLLDENPTRADEAYQALRLRLIRLFEWRHAHSPEDLADETLYRVAKRLGKGLEIEGEDPLPYACGVAFRVFKEAVREKAKHQRVITQISAEHRPAETDLFQEQRLSCLDRCLEGLSLENRKTILDYYHGEKSARIASRRELASHLGTTPGALRVRSLRLREKIEACVASCLEKKTE
ncbi:MAG: hypothetical protein K0U98_05840 [Deltaproteobacteria bacterium]|nr:hypothetical protein [Deltaproteobacteria bacterium]